MLGIEMFRRNEYKDLRRRINLLELRADKDLVNIGEKFFSLTLSSSGSVYLTEFNPDDEDDETVIRLYNIPHAEDFFKKMLKKLNELKKLGKI